jgi:hypothetical protein
MNVTEIFGSITAAIGLAKELVDVNKAVDQAQWKLKLAELTSVLADTKMGVSELKDEIDQRDKEISRLKAAFEFQGKTIKKHDMIYEMQDSGDPVGLPFCPRCLTVDGRYIKLTNLQKPGRPTQCPQCKSDYDRQNEYWAKDET